MYTDDSKECLSGGAIDDLHRVAAALEALELQMSVLSVKMHYDQSPHSPQAMELTRKVAEIHRQLDNVLTFGS
ncbi:hypothetical protein Pla52o_12880 [Novipirellula galeiformis]|uniref:Uncharacterized protein n=1 Tax=Novipirellula galeiformis TaxID=2528004 RepID=A0A5C6CNN4_9BACT|nr:hypothetical protein [Novipirellula galeiformis]TWU24991.1 hypothetical protein Pla52o_12880 [Novipirellula galeiformis]